VIKGMGITISHFLKNIADLRKDTVGMTYQWPEEPKPLPPTFRASTADAPSRRNAALRGVQLLRDCVPANCIEITGGDYRHDGVEKFPVRFDIDILQCVYCGLCVEACPCDAIRMDTGKITEAYYEGRSRSSTWTTFSATTRPTRARSAKRSTSFRRGRSSRG
jgi:NADH-quinone oxidoreductase subunit I